MDSNQFPINSRYHRVETTTLEIPEEMASPNETRTIVYLKRRFVPSAENFHLIQEHTVAQGDRLDNIAAKYLGDPEQFWRICDASNAMRPERLTEIIGRKLRITLPEGIPGPSTP